MPCPRRLLFRRPRPAHENDGTELPGAPRARKLRGCRGNVGYSAAAILARECAASFGYAARTSVGWLLTFLELVATQSSERGENGPLRAVAATTAQSPVASTRPAQMLKFMAVPLWPLLTAESVENP